MKKVLLGSLVAIMSLSSYAHDNQVCEYGLDYNINIDKKVIKFSNESTNTIEFTNSSIIVDGKQLKLNAEQQGYREQFDQRTRQVCPK